MLGLILKRKKKKDPLQFDMLPTIPIHVQNDRH